MDSTAWLRQALAASPADGAGDAPLQPLSRVSVVKRNCRAQLLGGTVQPSPPEQRAWPSPNCNGCVRLALLKPQPWLCGSGGAAETLPA